MTITDPDNDNLSKAIAESLAPAALADMSERDIEQLLNDVTVTPMSDATVARILNQANPAHPSDRTVRLPARSKPNRARPGSSREITMSMSNPQRPADRKGLNRGSVGAMLVSTLALMLIVVLTARPKTAEELMEKPPLSFAQATKDVITKHPGVQSVAKAIETYTPVKVGDLLKTAPQEQLRYSLPDGSVLFMNESTTARVESLRELSVQTGEVFVEVCPKFDEEAKREPFLVKTPGRRVKAVGTKFAVKARNEATDILVTQGKVLVDGVDETITAGRFVRFNGAKDVKLEMAPRASEALSWTQDLMAAAPIVPRSKFCGGALISVDPNGQEMNLSLRKYHVDVHIQDGFARTTIDQTYFNHTWSRLKGTFKFPLPADASLSRLAMYVGPKLMEGGMAERQHARNTFEQIVHTKRDPALLEWIDGSTFQMEVFPLEPRQEKRLLISYTQRLNTAYGKTHYRFPAGHNMDVVRDWSTKVRVKNGEQLAFKSPSHPLFASRVKGDLLLNTSMQDALLDRDFVLEIEDDWNKTVAGDSPPRTVALAELPAAKKSADVAFGNAPQPKQFTEATRSRDGAGQDRDATRGGEAAVAQKPGASARPLMTVATVQPSRPTTRYKLTRAMHEDHQYLMLRHRPELSTKAEKKSRNWVFLFETSGDRDPVLARTQIEVIRTLLDNAEHEDTFNIVSAGTRTKQFRDNAVPCEAKNIAEAVEWMEGSHIVGALDLQQAVRTSVRLCNPIVLAAAGNQPRRKSRGFEAKLGVPEIKQQVADVTMAGKPVVPGSAKARFATGGRAADVSEVPAAAPVILQAESVQLADKAEGSDDFQRARKDEKLSEAEIVSAGKISVLDTSVKRPGTKRETFLVHVGSGLAVLGETDQTALVADIPQSIRYVGVGVGKKWSRQFMRMAASRTGGYFTQINPDEKVHWRAFELHSVLNAPRLMNVGVVDDAEKLAFLTYTDSIAHGDEICAIARLAKDAKLPKNLIVSGQLNDKTWQETVAVADVTEKADYLPRSWARLEIDRLVADGATAHRDDIISLSKTMYVMSPFTSLLVLETDADYARYNVDRGRKDHWALYPAPDTIEVVTENGQRGRTAKARPRPQSGLATVLRRRESPLFRDRTLTFPGQETNPGGRVMIDFDFNAQNVLGFGRRFDTSIQIGNQFDTWSREWAEPQWLVNLNSIEVGQQLDDLVGGAARFGISAGRPLQENLVNRLYQEPLTRRAVPTWQFDDGYLDRTREAVQFRLQEKWREKRAMNLQGDVVLQPQEELEAIIARGNQSERAGVERLQQLKTVPSLGSEQMAAPRGAQSKYLPARRRLPKAKSRGISKGTRNVPKQESNSDGITMRRRLERVQEEVAPQPVVEFDVKNLNLLIMNEPSVGAGASSRSLQPSKPNQFGAGSRVYSINGRAPVMGGGAGGLAGGGGSTGGNGLSSFSGGLFNRPNMGMMPSEANPLNAFYGYSYNGVVDEGLSLMPGYVAPNGGELADDLLRLQLPRTRTTIDSWGIGGDRFELEAGPVGLGLADGPVRYYRKYFNPNENSHLPAFEPRFRRLLRTRQPLANQPWFDYLNAADFGRNDPRALEPLNGRFLNDLMAHAPGLNTTGADALAVMETESGNKPAIGTIDDGARKLIEHARGLGWETVTLGSGDDAVSVHCNGQGQFAWERPVSEGLREQVLCDGTNVWHLYDELGLGAKRAYSRFHRGMIGSVVPWLVAPVQELAIGADVVLVDDRTVGIVPLDPNSGVEKPGDNASPLTVRIELRFAKNGRLAERRMVSVQDGESQTLARMVFAKNGNITVFAADGKQAAKVQRLRKSGSAYGGLAPGSIAATLEARRDQLAILPLPYRSASHVFAKVGPKAERHHHQNRDYSEWSEENALALIASDVITGNSTRVADTVMSRFFRKDDTRAGLYVLIANAHPKRNDNQGQRPVINYQPNSKVPAAHLALVRFVRHLAEKPVQDQFAEDTLTTEGLNVDQARFGFIRNIAAARNTYYRWVTGSAGKQWARGSVQNDVTRSLKVVGSLKSAAIGWTILRAMQPHLKTPRAQAQFAGAAKRYENTPHIGWFVRHERARALFAANKDEEAATLYGKLLTSTLRAGFNPGIDKELRRQFIEHRGQRNWADMCRRTAMDLINEDLLSTAVNLSQQLRDLGDVDTASMVFDSVLAKLEPKERPDVGLQLVRIYRQRKDDAAADEMFERTLRNPTLAESAKLWRYGSELAGARGENAKSLERLERAINIEFATRPEVINLQETRTKYGQLIAKYEEIVDAYKIVEQEPPADLDDRIVRAADQWRSMEDNDTQVCQTTSRVLKKLGDNQRAWDYLTTPLATQPGSDSWRSLAQNLSQQGEIDEASVAYNRAFQLERTNPEILFEHATMLGQNQRETAASKLLMQIVHGKWQPRFRNVKGNATNLLRQQAPASEK